MWPLEGDQIPEIVLMRVDFPAPLSPIIAVTFPAGMSRSMFCIACTGPKDFDIPRRLNRASLGTAFAPESTLLDGPFMGVSAGDDSGANVIFNPFDC